MKGKCKFCGEDKNDLGAHLRFCIDNPENKPDLFSDDEPIVKLGSDVKPTHNVIFSNEDGEVGRLDFEGNEMKFTGKADEAAEVFFSEFLKNLCDAYLADKGGTDKPPFRYVV